MRAFAACPIAILRRKISDASLPASPPNSAITSSRAVAALFNLGPGIHCKIGEYNVSMKFP